MLLPRNAVFSAIAASLFLTATPAWAQDSDADGIPDAADAFPCDPAVAAIQYAPGAGAWSLLAFEDQWPQASDLDFNDVVVRAHYRLYRDAQGRVVRLTGLFDPVAVGGQYSSGLGLQLPASRSGATARRRVAGGAWQSLALQSDGDTTAILSDNLRELFGNAEGPINAEPDQARISGQSVELEVTFATPVVLNGALAPFDLFIFRDYQYAHQIHLPRYRGTDAMDTALFGTGVDATGPTRAFVDGHGLPYALDLSTSSRYPHEGRGIHHLFPEIIGFASSGGAQNTGFYASGVDVTEGHDIAALPVAAEPTPSTACIPTNPGPFTRIDIVFDQVTQTPWVTMWEIGLMSGASRVWSGFTTVASAGTAAYCGDNDATGSSWCLNVAPSASFSFIASSGNLPTHDGILLQPWGTRWPSGFRVLGRRADGTQVTILTHSGDGGWSQNVARTFAFPYVVTTPTVPTTPHNATGTFVFTGAAQSFTVPSGVTSIAVSMWGAGGGGGAPSRSQVANGGGGGYAAGTIAVTPGETLSIVVGGGGIGARANGGTGGYGGGGNGDTWLSAGGGGGGRSAIRRGSADLITAAGGGGGGYDYAGAAGGGSIGDRNAGDGGGGYGASQSAGGQGGGSSSVGQPGSAGQGGNGTYAGGGGGGGWFGGGGAGTVSGYGNGGGGGSGYLGGTGVTNGSLTAGVGITPGNGTSGDRAGAGTGGAGGNGSGGDGSPGRVIIRY